MVALNAIHKGAPSRRDALISSLSQLTAASKYETEDICVREKKTWSKIIIQQGERKKKRKE